MLQFIFYLRRERGSRFCFFYVHRNLECGREKYFSGRKMLFEKGEIFMSFTLPSKTLPLRFSNKIPGLSNVFLASQWQQLPGGLPIAAESGKLAAETIAIQIRKDEAAERRRNSGRVATARIEDANNKSTAIAVLLLRLNYSSSKVASEMKGWNLVPPRVMMIA